MFAAALLLALATAAGAVKAPESGFLFTAPKTLQTGTTERVCVTFFNFPGPGRRLRINITKGFSKDTTSFDKVVPDDVDADGDFCFDLDVPRSVSAGRSELEVRISRGAGLVFFKSAKVNIKPFTLVTLMQTDKPKYRPGDKVFIRLISLRFDLTPVIENVPEMWITTPDNIRVAQWKDVKTKGGLIQLEFQLTEEPPLGTWRIHARTTDDRETKRFSVEEYVLPTFELEVKSPTEVFADENTLTVDVCAKYTFGKPLIGADVTVTVSVFGRGDQDSNITDSLLTDEKGCASSDLIISGLTGFDAWGFRTRYATLNVTVTEFGTGLSQSETRTVTRSGPERHRDGGTRTSRADGSQLFIKPGLPYFGRALVKKRDGSPAPNAAVTVCYKAEYKEREDIVNPTKKQATPDDDLYVAFKRHADHVQSEYGYTPLFWETEDPERRSTARQCREHASDDAGRLRYYIPPQAEHVDSVSVEVGDGFRTNLIAFFSPSHSYLTIDAHHLPEELPCDGDVTAQLLTSLTGAMPPMVYQVLTRGRILDSGRVRGSSLTLKVTPSMSPQFKLLVFFVLESGEVVSDAIILKVQKCFNNEVKVNWDKETALPGKPASFIVNASPNSICGVSAVDRSTELLGTGNQITIDDVFSELRTFITRSYDAPGKLTTREYCHILQADVARTLKRAEATDAEPGQQAEPKPQEGGTTSSGSSSFGWPSPEDGWFRVDRLDALEAFEETGFLVMSNLALETRPCYKRVRPVDYTPPVFETPSRVSYSGVEKDLSVSAMLAPPGPPGHALFSDSEMEGTRTVAADDGVASGARGGGGDPPPPLEDQVREFFPEAFLFSLETVGSEGSKVLTQDMPDTITSWVGSAICSHPEDGFGLSRKSSIRAFKPFFTEVTLPYSVKRGEILNMSATVFNFLDTSLSVYLELAESDEYTLSGDGAPPGVDLCLSAGLSVVSYFPLTFLTLGEVNITVTARPKDGNCPEANSLSLGSDTVIRPIVVKPEGFPQQETTSRFICLDKGEESHVERVLMTAPDSLVPDSERAFFSVAGDLLGPSYTNLNNLVSVPRGSGETNMLSFVPHIYIRSYLERTGLLTPKDRDRTTNGMRNGYQRQLRYRRRDGSYSSFGRDDREGSLWLTAFVVKSFREASAYISIDESSTAASERWIAGKQQDDGCFPRFGTVIHKEMKGGTERGGPAALTAFVMLALDRGNIASNAIEKGFGCLEQGLLQTNKTLYSEILMTYTHVVLGRTERGQQLVTDLLLRAEREGPDAIFWKGDRRSIFGGSKAVDIEMTSYMVLSLLKLSGRENLEQAARAVKWINMQRNSFGGFVSSQDTIVGLQALTEFAKRTFSSELSSTVTVTAGGLPSTITVDSSNRLLLQQEKVADFALPAELQFEVSSGGCVIYQTIFRYSSWAQVPKPAFSLAVSSEVRPSRDPGSSYRLTVCASYIRDLGQSDRAALELELPSGYIAVDSTLRSLRQNGAVRKYDYSKDTVTFTLSNVAEEKTCLTLRIVRVNEVAGLKPSVARVFDVFRPEERNIVEYELAPVSAAADQQV